MSSRVLNQLKLMEGFLGETMQKRVAVVDTGGNKTKALNLKMPKHGAHTHTT